MASRAVGNRTSIVARLRSLELPQPEALDLTCRTLEAIRDEDLSPRAQAEKHERRAVSLQKLVDDIPYLSEITLDRDRLRTELLAQAGWDRTRARFHHDGARERQAWSHFFKQIMIVNLWRSVCGGRVWP